MDTVIAPTSVAERFDKVAVRAALEVLIERHGGLEAAHNDIVQHLKDMSQVARAHLRAQLERDGDGRRCAANLCQFQDDLICMLFELLTSLELKGRKQTAADRMAVVATGGYGRGLLAPGSDIDLLFLIHSSRKARGGVPEQMLYILWDMGFKVGHATRTVSQCVALARTDMTIATSLLDSRFLLGDAQLFAELEERFQDELRSMQRTFIDAKMAERDARHARSGDARYRVEPNIKDGKGGLRDLHTLHWLSRTIYGEDVGEKTVAAGIFTDEEVATFKRCEDFLWTIRCFLHFLTGRPEERLTFDVQPQMAEWLGYKKHGGLRATERFMKHYFLVAKEVGDLTTLLCGALEMQQHKTAPSISEIMSPLNWKVRRQIRQRTDFRVDNDRMNVADPQAFERDPVNILRLFAQAAKTNTFLHPDAIRLLRQSLRLIDDKVRNDPEANRIFLELLCDDPYPGITLRRMNDAAVLGRFIPAFRRVVGMMQFNMYHHFTVDEHLIRTVQMLTDIEQGGAANELPLATPMFETILNRRVLFVAAFLHDIGKGRRDDHSIVGARIARELCPRLGLSAAETDTVAWLIEEHLTMSNIAQSRDISDPKTIRDFADVVKSPERLKLLLLLTVADVRAVGPGTWNGWKGQLLRTLYYETELLLSGGYGQTGHRERISEAQEGVRAALLDEGWTPEKIESVTGRFYDDYWHRYDVPRQVEHARMMARTDGSDDKLAFHYTTDEFTAVTELTILAPNHARLLSLFAGACAATGANIVGAQISSTRDGYALDSFLLQRELQSDEDEKRRADRIGQLIRRVLRGEMRLRPMLSKRRPAEHRLDAFSVEPEVMINNALSDDFTVIEVAGLDRPGLLYDLTNALSDLNLDISSAHITTFGEKAVDVFYVTDLVGKKVTAPTRQQSITERLTELLAQDDPPPVT
ncbi:Bifunctional uridylyltransferase/uridylyl-removing enzyme [Includes: [Protein-PII] uridylyltransferase; [Protein-PII]-UMP uridylyl-removing enzyme] [Candidatus Filomicrobium marinum]|uniref:Bifunctional uridylyltransferase/uridylyl-removing enzyme n=1 Tax=Candidatus Filomicrobium marinum TaxID=1608628 RepID=A0A0D6JFS9_9HYPH|nr:[protein-PII] uridylyltransferase [Candidatus Filomicrobium marinum]CFX27218.1 Bifunctional uridylyltransferase/uridylyl-removing enzyme [Includes: [Protein-PII] uridylyltransferase; [Protein-PII]-UMP uridylyl-removing enzyme] [Candidatus Filomicrobium marinum]CPR19530.1 Bifunctional uridylyltransferase/uridylyl-removing enzyme [Includes: [Protein-PII] uridylyltransferase; [Protein-PII]-UMP uridylyl-removing enzyme] [Candidatus Filomicrobium marinum]